MIPALRPNLPQKVGLTRLLWITHGTIRIPVGAASFFELPNFAWAVPSVVEPCLVGGGFPGFCFMRLGAIRMSWPTRDCFEESGRN